MFRNIILVVIFIGNFYMFLIMLYDWIRVEEFILVYFLGNVMWFENYSDRKRKLFDILLVYCLCLVY